MIKHPFKLMKNRLNEAKPISPKLIINGITVDITQDFSIPLEVFNKLPNGSLVNMIE